MEMHQSIGTEKTISNLFKSYGKLHLISILPLSNNFENKRTCQMDFCPSFYAFFPKKFSYASTRLPALDIENVTGNKNASLQNVTNLPIFVALPACLYFQSL